MQFFTDRGRRDRILSRPSPIPTRRRPTPPTWHAALRRVPGRVTGSSTTSPTRSFLSFPVGRRRRSTILDLYTTVAEGYPNAFPPSRPDRCRRSSRTSANMLRGRPPRATTRCSTTIDAHASKVRRAGRGGYLDRDDFPLTPEGNRDAVARRSPRRSVSTTGPARRELSAQDPPPPPPEPPKVDFHGFVAFCGDYPKLAAPARPRGRPAARATAGHASREGRSESRSRESPGRAGCPRRRRGRGRNYEIDDRRFLARPDDRKATSSTGRCGSSGIRPVPGQPDRRRRQRAQDGRLRRQPASGSTRT